MPDRWMVSVAAVLCAGCTSRRPEPRAEQSAMQEADPSSSSGSGASKSPWAEHAGRCIVVEGYFSGGAKTGPRLAVGGWPLPGLDLEAGADQSWGAIEGSARVRAQGTLVERNDRPVMVERPGEPAMQGIVVPKGTDLEAARRHYVLTNATLRVLREPAAIEQDLRAQVGQVVELSGRLWSLNGHWWFNHDGLDLHLVTSDGVTAWEGTLDQHGGTVVVRGHLDRRPMPRIDQISIKSDRDQADAFIVTVDKTEPQPAERIEPCP